MGVSCLPHAIYVAMMFLRSVTSKVVTDVSRTLLRLEVCHLAGNATIPRPAPSRQSRMAPGEGDEELLIQAHRRSRLPQSRPPQSSPRRRLKRQGPKRAGASSPDTPILDCYVRGAAFATLVLFGIVSQLNSIALDIEPGDAQVHVPGTTLSIHTGGRLLLLPGDHVVRAERKGHVPSQTTVAVHNGVRATVRLRLAKLPGTLHLDTGDVAAVVSVDELIRVVHPV